LISIDKFLPLLAPLCPEAPETLTRQTIARSAQEFCRRTNILQDIATASAREQVGEYSVDLPNTQVQVNQLLGVAFRDTPMRLVGSQDVTLPMALRGEVDGVQVLYGLPQAAYFKTPSGDTFWLYPVPDVTTVGALTVRASFAPKLTATSLDDILFNEYADAVVNGAAFRLGSMPRQPWTNPNASQYGAVFEREVLKAKRDASMGRVKSTLAVQPRHFA
jgi:hypothetical protein